MESKNSDYLEWYRKCVKRLEKEMHPVLHALARMGKDSMVLLDIILDPKKGIDTSKISTKEILPLNPRLAMNSDGRIWDKFKEIRGSVFVYPLANHLVFWNDAPPKKIHDRIMSSGIHERGSGYKAQGIVMPYNTSTNSFETKDFEGIIKEVLGTPLEIDGKLFMLWQRDDGNQLNHFFCLDGVSLFNKGYPFHYANGDEELSITTQLRKIINGEKQSSDDLTTQKARILYDHFFSDLSDRNDWDIGAKLRLKLKEGWLEIKEGLTPTIIKMEDRSWMCLFYLGDLWVWPTKS